MKFVTLILSMILPTSSYIIYDFAIKSDINKWTVVDDAVMGGKSTSTFKINSNGHGEFKGTVSLKNNGGFSSIRYRFSKININKHAHIVLKICGDGKKYQLRIKTNSSDYYSYISYFSTSGDWQEIEIPLKDFYPTFRGRKLNKANFSDQSIEEIGFLIGNKKEESFKLMIDKIELK